MPEVKFLKKLSVQDLVVTEITDKAVSGNVYSYNERYKQGSISLDEINDEFAVNGVYCGDNKLGDSVNSFSLEIFSDKNNTAKVNILPWSLPTRADLLIT